MWRMALFIRHICGKRKNTVGHRCSALESLKNSITAVNKNVRIQKIVAYY